MDMQVDVWGNLDSFEHVKANPILMMSEQENFMLSRKRFVFNASTNVKLKFSWKQIASLSMF